MIFPPVSRSLSEPAFIHETNNQKITTCSKETVKLDCLLKDVHKSSISGPVKSLYLQLRHIASIYMCSSQLKSLHANTFQDLTALSQIVLVDNKLTTLNPRLFQACMGSLTILLLNENRLERLEPGIFNGLVNLKKLHLAGILNRSFLKKDRDR